MTLDTVPSSQPTETEQTAEALLPLLSGDGFNAKRAEYLSKRVCNFTVREACKLCGIHEKTVHRWRESDEQFEYLDTEGMTNLRKQLGMEFLNMQFTRNMSLFLEKDFKILYKDAIGATLTDDEKSYLIKVRQHYTPQSLAMIKQLVGGGTIQEPFNFTKLTMTLMREKIEVVQER